MITTIQKWGNSQGIRLPKHLLDSADISENQQVEVVVENGVIQIKRVNKVRHLTIRERFADYDGNCKSTEWDTGIPLGKEVF